MQAEEVLAGVELLALRDVDIGQEDEGAGQPIGVRGALVDVVQGLLLGGGMGDNKAVQPMGVLLLLLSALSNSLYIVGLHVVKPRHMTGLGVTFWVLAFGSLICLGNALAMGSFSLPADLKELGIAFLLAAVTAALSNLTLVLAIQRIGSTMASVLGVMEPPTAVCVGILVFDEPSSASLWIGMCLICLSVLVVMLGPRIGSRRAKKQ